VQGLPIAQTSLADYLHPVTGYLQTNFVTAKAVSRPMIEQGSGVILTISTPGARLTGRGLIGNAAQSAGLEGFSRALAGELGPAGVRVVCVRPHAMADAWDTSYTGEMFGRIAASTGTNREDWLAGLASGTLLGHLPTLDDVAEYLAFAASDRAGSMTGAIANLTVGALVD
jgi:3-oxoacyl-[acyl-carrier protein] reductase